MYVVGVLELCVYEMCVCVTSNDVRHASLSEFEISG